MPLSLLWPEVRFSQVWSKTSVIKIMVFEVVFNWYNYLRCLLLPPAIPKMPVHTYLDQLSPTGGMVPVAVPTQSVSCPADLDQMKHEPYTEDHIRCIAKERQKKDNHNMSKYTCINGK